MQIRSCHSSAQNSQQCPISSSQSSYSSLSSPNNICRPSSYPYFLLTHCVSATLTWVLLLEHTRHTRYTSASWLCICWSFHHILTWHLLSGTSGLCSDNHFFSKSWLCSMKLQALTCTLYPRPPLLYFPPLQESPFDICLFIYRLSLPLGSSKRAKNLVCLVYCILNGTPLQYFCLENPMDGGAW